MISKGFSVEILVHINKMIQDSFDFVICNYKITCKLTGNFEENLKSRPYPILVKDQVATLVEEPPGLGDSHMSADIICLI